MNRIVTALLTLAALHAGPALAAGGDPAAGEKKAQTCVACHGPKGAKPIQPSYAVLAGQYESYLVRALKDYKSGARQNAIMNAQAANLSPQDIRDLAAYFAKQKGLEVVEY